MMVSDLPIGKFDSRVYAHQLKGFESKATDSTNLTSEILDNRLSDKKFATAQQRTIIPQKGLG